jgi:hypothetical protein
MKKALGFIIAALLLSILPVTGWLVASTPGGPDNGVIVAYHGATKNSGVLISTLTAGDTVKANKHVPATPGNLATLNAAGDLGDAGVTLPQLIAGVTAIAAGLQGQLNNKPDRSSFSTGTLAEWNGFGNLDTGPDANAVLLSTMASAKGDMIGFDASVDPGILPAGVDGYVLTCESGATLGWRWEVAAAGGSTIDTSTPTTISGLLKGNTATVSGTGWGTSVQFYRGDGGWQAITEAKVTDLVSDLAGKAATGHNHTGVYAPASHAHSGADITSGTVDESYIDSDIARDSEVAAGDTPKMNKKPAFAGHFTKFATTTGDSDDGGTIGTAAHSAVGDFATSGHNHAGVYEPAIAGGATTKISKAIGTAKGDLISFSASATPGVLAGATNNYVLTRDSSAALGIKWAAASSGTITYTKSAIITSPTVAANSSRPMWRQPTAATITGVSCLCVGGTNIKGQAWEYDGNGANGAVIDGSSLICTAGSNVNDDGALSNPSIDAGDFVGWVTSSISGTVTYCEITITYTVP